MFPPIQPDHSPGLDDRVSAAAAKVGHLRRRYAAVALGASAVMVVAIVVPLTNHHHDKVHNVAVAVGSTTTTSDPIPVTIPTTVPSTVPESTTTTGPLPVPTTRVGATILPTTVPAPTTTVPQLPVTTSVIAGRPIPSQYQYTGMACVTEHSCFATLVENTQSPPSTGQIAHWDGVNWDVLAADTATSAPDGSLNGISCGAATTCMAVGTSNANLIALSYMNGHWESTTVPKPALEGAAGQIPEKEAFTAISCFSATECVAVGQEYYKTVDTPNNYMFAMVWNGSSWNESNLTTSDPTEELSGISCFAPTACIAVGASNYGPTWYSPAPLAERWDGTTWSRLSLPAGPSGYSFLDGIACPTVNWCVAVGAADYPESPTVSQPLSFVFDHGAWTTVGSSPGKELHAVACEAAARCVEVGWTDGQTSGVADAFDEARTSVTRFRAPIYAVAEAAPGEYLFPTNGGMEEVQPTF